MANPFQLDVGENVILESRRHWINVLPAWTSGWALAIVAVVVSYLSGRFPDSLNKYVPTGLFTIVVVILLALAIAIVLLGTWVYRQNRLVLTNQHLIKVEQNGLFSRKVSQLALSRVQDVNGSRHGVIATILNFGSVEVQSAGEDEEFIFIQMPNPASLADELMRAHDQFSSAPESGTE